MSQVSCFYLSSLLEPMRNIFVFPKMVKMAIANLNLSKLAATDCDLTVVLKNVEPKIS